MSTALRERTTTTQTRKIVSHGTPISGHGTTTTSSLENNLDALLEDLQTSVSRSATPSGRVGRTHSPQIEYRAPANTTKVVSEGRTISPTRTTTTTTEKFVSTGPSGAPSGIPGLDFLDAELQNVQPGQSKTVAYKQVSYQLNKSFDGKPVESWRDNTLANTGSPLIDDIRERTYEESRTQRHRSPEPITKTSAVSKEVSYTDGSTTRLQASPVPGSQRDVKYVHDSSSYHTDPRPLQIQQTIEEYGSVEEVPIPSPTPSIPINLAPGPNTKVTTTIKTYTYELPGAPENYLQSSGSLSRGVVLPGDQTITYTLPRTDKTVTYQAVTENTGTPPRYTPTTTESKKTLHKEAKFYREECHSGQRPYQPSLESRTTVTKNEKYYQMNGNYPNGHAPTEPVDGIDYHPGQPETRMVVNRVEEHYSSSRPPSAGRHPSPEKRPPGPQTSSSSTTVYKYSNTTSTVPPNRNAEDHEVLLPKPFPTGVQICPAKPSGPTEQTPPARLEDLMASFSDSEREVLEDIDRQEKQRQKKEPSSTKKEVEFVGHTPPKVKSKNVAGPPVYYPPGSAEFTKKEESSAAMSQSGGGWQKAKGKYEYEASSKSKSKSSSGGAVVPVCLPLCCALPCVIM